MIRHYEAKLKQLVEENDEIEKRIRRSHELLREIASETHEQPTDQDGLT